jgi:hypothetical protein
LIVQRSPLEYENCGRVVVRYDRQKGIVFLDDDRWVLPGAVHVVIALSPLVLAHKPLQAYRWKRQHLHVGVNDEATDRDESG